MSSLERERVREARTQARQWLTRTEGSLNSGRTLQSAHRERERASATGAGVTWRVASSVWREQGPKTNNWELEPLNIALSWMVSWLELRKNALLFQLNMVQTRQIRVSKLQGMMVDFDDITIIIV